MKLHTAASSFAEPMMLASRLSRPLFGAMFGAALVLTLPRDAATPGTEVAAGPASTDSVVVSDTLLLYYLGYPIGRERYELRAVGEGHNLTMDFDYTDRGRRTHLTGELRVARDHTPTYLAITRRTDSSTSVETRVEVRGREATVLAWGRESTVALPPVAFAIAGHAPVTQHLMLLRYWMAHGRPRTLAVVPGGPVNEVTIEYRGRDTLALGNARVMLARYSVDGVVWGIESVWLDEAGRLAAIATRAGGLTLEAIREELAPLFPELMAIATRDRMVDLARISGRVRPIAEGTMALVGATLIDGRGGPALPNAAVLVSNGRVVAAGASAGVAIPAGTRRIDVRGKTIIPGLWDMHTHMMQIEWAPVYLAAGVTTVRDMGNELSLILPFRAAVDSGRVLGPRILIAGLVDGGGPNAFGAVNATTAEEGRAVIRHYHALGFEQIKLYSLLKPEVVSSIIHEAHALGMTVTGHIPVALTLTAAVDSGMDHIAHLPIRGEAQSDSVRRTIDLLKARGTVIDPTASWGELLQHSPGEPVSAFQPGVRRLPPVLAQRMSAMGAPNVDTLTAHARLARTLGIIGALHRAGVPVVAGTDQGVPGFSIYREMELYVAAGMSPMEALRSATAVPARAMRLDREVGTLEPGKRADLVVLDADPLEAIANVRAVRLVMKAGTLYESSAVWRAVGFR